MSEKRGKKRKEKFGNEGKGKLEDGRTGERTPRRRGNISFLPFSYWGRGA